MGMSGGLIGLARRAPWLVEQIQRIGWLNSLLNEVLIDSLITKGEARPLPFSLWTPRPIGHPQPARTPEIPVDYISWTSLVDRRFTARHLPPADQAYVDRLPPLDDVLALYKRDAFTPSKTTSSLLCFFAQWFTDSVLRTNIFDRRLNTSNHEIDLCQIYGLDAETTAILRTHKGGLLKTSRNGLFPARLTGPDAKPLKAFRGLPYLAQLKDGQTLEDEVLGTLDVPKAVKLQRKARLYATGLERGNSTVIYAAISTVFIREHNRIAGELAKTFPAWDDHRLFHTARNINIVLLLCLVINEYINHLAQSPFRLSLERHFAERKSWYRANRIAIEFDLLYRWHSLTPNVLTVRGVEIPGDDYRFNNALLERHGVEALIAAASREPAGRVGVRNNPDFLAKAEWNAQAFARAQRVRSFTEYQVCFHDEVVKSFDDLAGGDKALAAELSKLYGGRIEDVELLVGLFAQHHDDDEVLPGLMQTMVAVDAFSQILTNPLLATNIYCEQAFSAIGEDIINSTKSFQQLVARNAAPGTEGEVYASFALHPAGG
jgi:prostaglandin-endoperoxide synthase 2